MTAERVLLDSTFVFGLLNSKDQHYQHALRCLSLVKSAVEVLITEAVLIEVGNSLCSRRKRQDAVQFINTCYEGGEVEVVTVSTGLLRRALDFYQQHQDKDWGLTDCISFVVMNDRGIQVAVTADSDFVQAGFRALMLEV
jgi:hypothetical protein